MHIRLRYLLPQVAHVLTLQVMLQSANMLVKLPNPCSKVPLSSCSVDGAHTHGRERCRSVSGQSMCRQWDGKKFCCGPNGSVGTKYVQTVGWQTVLLWPKWQCWDKVCADSGMADSFAVVQMAVG